jgi:hypothetical protein
MKEQSLIEMKNKVEALSRVMQQVINELTNLRDLSIGTLEALKNMPGYNEAIEKLKADVITKSDEKKLELDVE